MRSAQLLVLIVLFAPCAAEPLSKAEVGQIPEKRLPLKSMGTGNSCAAYGPGFVKVDGTDSCVKIGGGIQINGGAATVRGR